jgi:hypothetical protein
VDENMKALCEEYGVDFKVLVAKADCAAENKTTFTEGELQVIVAALEIAGGL